MSRLAFVLAVSAALVFGASKADPPPTYARDIAPVIQKRCEGCHRPGQIGPFPLTNYAETRAFATEIKAATGERRMPPWHAEPGYGDFANERRLSDAEIKSIARWVDAGSPRGNLKDLPPPVKYSDEWMLGKPDLVLTPSEEFELGAAGVDEYRCFVLPSDLTEDRTVQAVEVRPGDRRVVHHLLAYVDTSGKARELDAKDPLPGYRCNIGGLGFLPSSGMGGWAPGISPRRLPEGVGRPLPRGSDVVIQVHYHRNGRIVRDRTSLGLYFNATPADRYLKSIPIVNFRIRIPAGAERHREEAHFTLRRDMLAWGATPHMHLLGKEMRMTATLPDGTVKDLVWVKKYEFKWQTEYIFRDPFPLPAGTKIDVVAYYDNSEKNPDNPHKVLRDVTWGEETTDEMLVGFLAYITPK